MCVHPIGALLCTRVFMWKNLILHAKVYLCMNMHLKLEPLLLTRHSSPTVVIAGLEWGDTIRLAPAVDEFDVPPRLTPDDPRFSTAFHPDNCGEGDAESWWGWCGVGCGGGMDDIVTMEPMKKTYVHMIWYMRKLEVQSQINAHMNKHTRTHTRTQTNAANMHAHTYAHTHASKRTQHTGAHETQITY